MAAVIKRGDIPGLVIMAILGTGLTILGIVKYINAAETKSWPVTKGEVTVSEVGGSMKYTPSVTYIYRVDTTDYSSNGIETMNFNSKNREYVQEYIGKYPVGATVDVFYNPVRPEQAFLEPGAKRGHLYLLGFGILVLAVPVLSVIFMKFDLKKES
jgi:hypothetical protein